MIIIIHNVRANHDFHVRAHHDAPQQSQTPQRTPSIWQRNYYEHIIRNEIELNKIRQYIKNNPELWDRDRNNPEKIK